MEGEFRFPWLPSWWHVETTDRSYEGVLLVSGDWSILIEEDIKHINYDVFIKKEKYGGTVKEVLSVDLEEALDAAKDAVAYIESGGCEW